MKFIADSMLGRLAKWLRLLGYDTLYYSHIEDSLILRISRDDDRVLLTRDTRLVQVRGLKKFLLLKDNNPFTQLRRVITVFDLRVRTGPDSREPLVASRCTVCNACLDSILRESVKNSVPLYVYQTSRAFRKCSGCGKIYWDGTHTRKFKEKFVDLL